MAVLLAKRAEQIAHPAAIIHGENGHTDDEEIQFVVNEHANRIMVYADMLLQMQVDIPLIYFICYFDMYKLTSFLKILVTII